MIRTTTMLAILLLLQACAASPTYRTDVDPDADFSAYETYAFFSEPGTDMRGYSTLITQHFKDAVGREMEKLGYRYDEDDPDLLVNFSANIVEKTRERPSPTISVGYGHGFGYYGYRGSLYATWPLYEAEAEPVTYEYGTANVDVIDAERSTMIWEGVAEGKLTEAAMQNPREAIFAAMEELFSRYPAAR